MHRRTLIAGAAIATLTWETTMSDTASAQHGRPIPRTRSTWISNAGRVVIQMFPDIAPKHVERIKLLAREGFYDNTPFHRVIEGFMAQGGDPDRHRDRRFEAARPARRVQEQAPLPAGQRAAMARTSEPEQREQPVLHHVFEAAPHLDGQYTVWGQVDAGHGIDRSAQARQRRRRHGGRTLTGSCTCGWRPDVKE